MLKITHSLCVLLLAVCVQQLRADTPVNCTYEEIKGVWEFSESSRSAERTEVCDGTQKLVNTIKIELLYPNIAVDEFGHNGLYTKLKLYVKM